MQKLIFVLVALLLIALPFHAFFFTWFKSFFWTNSWTVFVQAWKEILLLVVGGLAFVQFLVNPPTPPRSGVVSPLIKKRLRGVFSSIFSWIKNPLVYLPLSLVVLASSYLLLDSGTLGQKIFGFRQITLPLIAFLIGTLIVLSAKQKLMLNRLLVLTTGLVVAFGLALLFVLPHDFLASYGYSRVVSTWLPGGNLPMYHLVGGTDLIRAQSSFSGPNQLGAWLLVALPLVALSALGDHRRWHWVPRIVLAGGLALLVFTYSRGAWLGGLVAVSLLVLHLLFTYLPRQKAVLATTCLVFTGCLAIGSLFVLDTPREIILREASSHEHLEQTLAATQLTLREPLGLGLGSTAGGAQRFADGLTPENDYLGTALQLGWLGGALFFAWLMLLGRQLWAQRSPLAYSLIGVAVVMLFLHPLSDAPTAITLMLLAGIASRDT